MLKVAKRGRYEHTLLDGPGRRKLVGAECALCGSFRNKTSTHFTRECPNVSAIKDTSITEKPVFKAAETLIFKLDKDLESFRAIRNHRAMNSNLNGVYLICLV